MRIDKRNLLDLRPISIEVDRNSYAEGACLYTQGKTKILTTVTVEERIPSFIKEKNDGSGWLTAEYAMLPRSTQSRINRERQKINARSSEIQRLIGRSLRAMVDLSKIGERTIIVDCDVLQADGGTRCAAINSAAVAIAITLAKLQQQEKITEIPIISLIGAVSQVLKDDQILVDPDYQEDSNCDMDLNLVINKNQEIIELQATSEGKAANLSTVNQMINIGCNVINKIFFEQEKIMSAYLP